MALGGSAEVGLSGLSSSPPLGMSGHVKQLVHSNPIRASKPPPANTATCPPLTQTPCLGRSGPPCGPWARQCGAGQGLVLLGGGHVGPAQQRSTNKERLKSKLSFLLRYEPQRGGGRE
ncbi:unnamed protein product, partial [Boreogadus saida]